MGDLRVLLQNLRAAEGPLLQFVPQRAILRADPESRVRLQWAVCARAAWALWRRKDPVQEITLQAEL